MPTYQYVCTACAEPLEAVQSFDDDPLTECPACGGSLRKVFSPVGVVFKGSGFYRTDSRGKTGKSSAATPTPSTPSADKPADKPAATPTGSSSSTAGSSSTGSTPPAG